MQTLDDPRDLTEVLADVSGKAAKAYCCHEALRRYRGPLFSVYLQDFYKWRDPDSNRGHHDFQSYSEAFRYAVNPHK